MASGYNRLWLVSGRYCRWYDIDTDTWDAADIPFIDYGDASRGFRINAIGAFEDGVTPPVFMAADTGWGYWSDATQAWVNTWSTSSNPHMNALGCVNQPGGGWNLPGSLVVWGEDNAGLPGRVIMRAQYAIIKETISGCATRLAYGTGYPPILCGQAVTQDGYIFVPDPDNGIVHRRTPGTGGSWSSIGSPGLTYGDGSDADSTMRTVIAWSADKAVAMGYGRSFSVWNGSGWTNKQPAALTTDILDHAHAYDEDHIYTIGGVSASGDLVVNTYSIANGFVSSSVAANGYPRNATKHNHRIFAQGRNLVWYTQSNNGGVVGGGLWRYDPTSGVHTAVIDAYTGTVFFSTTTGDQSPTALMGNPYLASVALTGVDKDVISEAGGEEIVITGSFPIGEDLRVYLGPLGTSEDPPCYSGVAGEGYTVQSEDGTTINVITPPNPVGSAKLSVIYDVEPPINLEGITVVERSFCAAPMGLRRLLPRWYAAGARGLDQED